MKTVFENIWMYFKFFLFKFIIEVLVLLPISLVFYPLAYVFRGSIYRHPKTWKWLLLYWLVSSNEDTFLNNWYGLYEIWEGTLQDFHDLNWWQKFGLSYKWGIRNWAWNTKQAIGRLLFKSYSIFQLEQHMDVIKHEPEVGDAWEWRNKTTFGIQKITFRIWGTKHFRYSFTLPLDRVWLGRILRIFNKRRNYFNLMIGTDKKRFLFKSRWFEYNSNTNNKAMKTLVNGESEIKIYPVEIYKTFWGKWRWRVTASNGRIIGASSQGYWNKGDMLDNVESLGYSLSNSDVFQK
tara:strand:- start:29260 stop:30135 length:876 start_codon:yes stop_codon:yes gene_type:complete